MEVNKEMCTFAKNKKNMDYKRNIQQEIEKQKKWVEIGKATVEGCIKEGQPQEIIDYEMENLKKDEALLEQLLKEAENGH